MNEILATPLGKELLSQVKQVGLAYTERMNLAMGLDGSGAVGGRTNSSSTGESSEYTAEDLDKELDKIRKILSQGGMALTAEDLDEIRKNLSQGGMDLKQLEHLEQTLDGSFFSVVQSIMRFFFFKL